MYRFLLSWRWAGALLLTVAIAAGCVVLGLWQWDRRESRLERNALVTDNYDLPPAALSAVLDGDPSALPAGREWTPVHLRGQYLTDHTVLLRNRPLDGRPGHHVLVPFAADTGDVLVVDRGWLPIGQTAVGPDEVPEPPTGTVEVVARLRPPEPRDGRDAPAGQTQSLTPDALDLPAAVRADLVTGAYGVLGSEQPAPATAPRALPRPPLDEGPHLSYSMQWFVFAVGAFIALVVVVRRTAAPAGAHEDAAPQGRPARSRRASAEDEEDAIVEAQLARRAAAPTTHGPQSGPAGDRDRPGPPPGT